MTYAQPKDLEEALGLLEQAPWAILSGGTDFYPSRLERPMDTHVLDIHALEELKEIRIEENAVRIGAGVTWSDLMAADLPPAFDGLKLAAREVGSVQIQNRATLVGNLCNASPAADGVPPLLTLDAEVELLSRQGHRQLALKDFILGNRHTARRPDEMVSAIVIPADATLGQSEFQKIGARQYLLISVSMVAGRMVCKDDGTISEVALSVGSCSLVAQRLTALENELVGMVASEHLGQALKPEHLNTLSPINDVRSTVQYRIDASFELIRRLLNSLGGRA